MDSEKHALMQEEAHPSHNEYAEPAITQQELTREQFYWRFLVRFDKSSCQMFVNALFVKYTISTSGVLRIGLSRSSQYAKYWISSQIILIYK